MMSLSAKNLLDKIDVTSKVHKNLTSNGLGLGLVALANKKLFAMSTRKTAWNNALKIAVQRE